MTMRNVFLAAVLICFLPAAGFAQSVSLTGRVADPQGGFSDAALLGVPRTFHMSYSFSY